MIESFKNGIKSASFKKESTEKEVISQDKLTTWLFSIEDFGKGKAIFSHMREGSSINVQVSYPDMKYKEIPQIVLSYIGHWIIKVMDNEYHLEVVDASYGIVDVMAVARVKSGEIKEQTVDDEIKAAIARLSRENEQLKAHIRTMEHEIRMIKKELI